MSLQDIASRGMMLPHFLALINSYFHGVKGRRLFAAYVRGLLSELQRKNVEAIALKEGVAPRTLQRFLESIKWDHDEVLRRCRQTIASEQSAPQAIGVIDETGTAKAGKNSTRRSGPESATINVEMQRRDIAIARNASLNTTPSESIPTKSKVSSQNLRETSLDITKMALSS